MSRLNSANVQANEVVKATDINFGFDAQITNVSKMIQSILETRQDFVINGIVEEYSGGGMNVKVNPVFGVCKTTENPFVETGITEPVSIGEGWSVDRIDILEVWGELITTAEEQRAFIDFDTKEKTLRNVDTQKELLVHIEVKHNPNDGNVYQTAPAKTPGRVKLAEIFVPANASDISECEIFNITSDIQGVENENWTADKTATYNIGYLSEVNEKFREQHNADGSHKAKVIGKTELNLTQNDGNQFTGVDLYTGQNISVNGETKGVTTSVSSLLSTLATKITDLFNSYLKNGAFNFNGEIAASSMVSSNVLTNAIKIGASGNGSAYCKIGGTKIFDITTDGKIRMPTGYMATATTDLITKSVTDAIITTVNSHTTTIEYILNNLDPSAASNLVFSKFKFGENLAAATTQNITLAGSQSIDGVLVDEGELVLVKNQTNSTENGIYEVSSGAWSRGQYTAADDDNAETPPVKGLAKKFFQINKGTVNKDKLFYCSTDNFTVDGPDASSINFVEAFISIKKKPYSLVLRNGNGEIEGINLDNYVKRYTYIIQNQADFNKWINGTAGNDYTSVYLKNGIYTVSSAMPSLKTLKTKRIEGESRIGVKIKLLHEDACFYYDNLPKGDSSEYYIKRITVEHPYTSPAMLNCRNVKECDVTSHGGTWIVGQGYTSESSEFPKQGLYYSTDGEHFNKTNINDRIEYVGHAGKYYFASGYDNGTTSNDQSKSHTYFSEDGINWTEFTNLKITLGMMLKGDDGWRCCSHWSGSGQNKRGIYYCEDEVLTANSVWTRESDQEDINRILYVPELKSWFYTSRNGVYIRNSITESWTQISGLLNGGNWLKRLYYFSGLLIIAPNANNGSSNNNVLVSVTPRLKADGKIHCASMFHGQGSTGYGCTTLDFYPVASSKFLTKVLGTTLSDQDARNIWTNSMSGSCRKMSTFVPWSWSDVTYAGLLPYLPNWDNIKSNYNTNYGNYACRTLAYAVMDDYALEIDNLGVAVRRKVSNITERLFHLSWGDNNNPMPDYNMTMFHDKKVFQDNTWIVGGMRGVGVLRATMDFSFPREFEPVTALDTDGETQITLSVEGSVAKPQTWIQGCTGVKNCNLPKGLEQYRPKNYSEDFDDVEVWLNNKTNFGSDSEVDSENVLTYGNGLIEAADPAHGNRFNEA